jgi:hypothetical protein
MQKRVIKDAAVDATFDHYMFEQEEFTPANTIKAYKPKQKEWNAS